MVVIVIKFDYNAIYSECHGFAFIAPSVTAPPSFDPTTKVFCKFLTPVNEVLSTKGRKKDFWAII